MFGLVSKKKYDELEERYRKISGDWRERCYEKIIDAQEYVRLQKEVIDLQKEKQSMQEEITRWKRMYVDEVQKRIEMTELMKNQ